MSESEHDDEIEAGFLAAYGERATTDVFADIARGGFRRGVEWERRRGELAPINWQTAGELAAAASTGQAGEGADRG